MTDVLAEFVADLPLFDHHCHGVVRDLPDRAAFELLATESDWAAPAGTTVFDSPFGVTVRAECAPLLDLPRHCTADDYLRRRFELGVAEVNERLLPRTGISVYGIDTGFRTDTILTPPEMAALGRASAVTIVRLEQVAEEVFEAGTTAAGFAADFASALDEASRHAVGYKSIVAYRYGLDFDPVRPGPVEVRDAAAEVLRDQQLRVAHPVLLRHLLWSAVDRRLPLQFHVGYGDSDINLHRCDPSQMTEFIRLTRESGAQIMLLHCYPFQREAAYLAQVFPHVYLDTGAAVNYTGAGARDVVRESLELAPFHKVLFSTDAFGLPELYYCGTLLWRRAVTDLFGHWVDSDLMGLADARRYLTMLASGNAERVYPDVRP
ncbi:MAG: amidohydrolase family protein [Streptosporangiales bacterium]|nr:amidohydrolase family protein [Streptosporangiales bacterium]